MVQGRMSPVTCPIRRWRSAVGATAWVQCCGLVVLLQGAVALLSRAGAGSGHGEKCLLTADVFGEIQRLGLGHHFVEVDVILCG